MDEERQELINWLKNKAKNAKDQPYFNEIKRILELAPVNLTYSLKRFREETIHYDDFTPMYVDGGGTGPRCITGFRMASLDGGGFGPDEDAIVFEVDE